MRIANTVNDSIVDGHGPVSYTHLHKDGHQGGKGPAKAPVENGPVLGEGAPADGIGPQGHADEVVEHQAGGVDEVVKDKAGRAGDHQNDDQANGHIHVQGTDDLHALGQAEPGAEGI